MVRTKTYLCTTKTQRQRTYLIRVKVAPRRLKRRSLVVPVAVQQHKALAPWPHGSPVPFVPDFSADRQQETDSATDYTTETESESEPAYIQTPSTVAELKRRFETLKEDEAQEGETGDAENQPKRLSPDIYAFGSPKATPISIEPIGETDRTKRRRHGTTRSQRRRASHTSIYNSQKL